MIGFSITARINAARYARAANDSAFWTFAATEWHRLYRPYVPFKEGLLYSTVNITGGYGNGTIEHTVPYAHYAYEGEVYGPNRPITQGGAVVGYYSPVVPKHPTGSMMQYSGMGTRHWDEAAVPTKRPALIRAMQGYVDSGRLNLGR